MRAGAVVVLVMAAVLLAACGSEELSKGGDAGGATTDAGQIGAIRSTYQRYFEAVKTGNGEQVCALLTAEYQEQVVIEAQGFDGLENADCPDATTAFRSLLDGFEPSLEDVQVDGGTATGYDPGQGPYEPQTVEFQEVDGEWRISGLTDEPAEDAGLPSPSTVENWPSKWCQATPGMTRAALRALMGEPTSEHTPETTSEGFQPQMTWEAYEYHFTAFFGVDDRVRQLDVNDLDLSAQQREAIDCAFSRRG